MGDTLVHQKFGPIASGDIDRHHELLRNGLPFDSAVITSLIEGRIGLAELNPALQALILESFLQSSPFEQTIFGDGSTTVFALNEMVSAGTEDVSINGQIMYRNVDYTLSGTSITFIGGAPLLGSRIFIKAIDGAIQAILVNLGGFVIPYENIIESRPTIVPNVQELFTYGTNKSTSDIEVAKFGSIALVQLGSAVNVSSGSPDNSAMILLSASGVNFLWAVGAVTGTNTLTQIDISDMSSSVFNVDDATTTISALATDGTHIYAFMKGGSTLAANGVEKINGETGVMEAVIGPGTPGITTTGIVDVAISLAGFLYVSYGNINGTGTGEVRKFDSNTGALLQQFTLDVSPTQPIRLIAVLDNILVLDNLQNKIFEISSTDVVTTLVTLAFTPTDIEFDQSELWISSASTLNKVTLAGTILNSLDPQTGKTIQNVRSGLGLIWTTYSDDSGIPDFNFTKIFPGLSGSP